MLHHGKETLVCRLVRKAIVERDETRLVIRADRSDPKRFSVPERHVTADRGRIADRHHHPGHMPSKLLEHGRPMLEQE
jgi:hypothetical protein